MRYRLRAFEEEGPVAQYLFIESRDTFESNDVAHYLDLATELAAGGNAVTVFLVQNGVLTARRSSHAAKIEALTKAGVTVLADEFSLRERGIPADRLVSGVKPSPIDVVVDHLADGHKTLWH
jgi:intracellular sulfur oxidation DsrE/DsrF family protein